MQDTHTTGTAMETERRRARAVVETLAGMRLRGGTVAEVAHDARNMVTALALYCDLLEEPGVLFEDYRHYATELRLVAAASRRVVEKLTLLDDRDDRDEDRPAAVRAPRDFFAEMLSASPLATRAQRQPNDPIDNLQEELLANHNLLDSIAGMAIAVTVRTEGGARPVRISSEDLTRVLVNLVKNSAEAIRGAGRIEIALCEQPGADGGVPAAVVLAIEDTGPGIPAEAIDRIFEAGYTSHTAGEAAGAWPAPHRGLGLAITRTIVEASGGRVRAIPRNQGGAHIEIELPIRAN